jgi:hypothetical protein
MILPVILMGTQLAIAVQNTVPNLDVGPSCRAAADGSLGLNLRRSRGITATISTVVAA